jgi:hypothetical protein
VGGERSLSFGALLSFGRLSSFVGGQIRFWAVMVSFVFVVISGWSSFPGSPHFWAVALDRGRLGSTWWRRGCWLWVSCFVCGRGVVSVVVVVVCCWLQKISHVTHCDMCIMYKQPREITFRWLHVMITNWSH